MSAARRRRFLRASRAILGVAVAATLLQSGPAQADGDQAAATTLGGYQGTAAAQGLHAFYNLGDVLPIPSPADLGSPDALATIAAGPATYARASVADPGDLLANPDAVLALFSSAYPAGTLPPYPYRVSAASGSGAPTAEVSAAPGLDAKVSATDGASSAIATMPAAQAPAVATFGTLSASATTTTDGSTVSVHAISKTADLDVLGLVVIHSITTDLTATSDGTKTKLSGGTTIGGATLLGQPITIDADGIHASKGSAALLAGVLGPLTDGLNGVLKSVGITITLAGSGTLDAGTSGQRTSAGLRIDLELSQKTVPGLEALLAAIPPIDNPIPGTPSIEDVLQLAKARHLASIVVGGGQVALAASPGYDGSVPPTDTSGDVGSYPGTTGSFDLPIGSDVPPTTAGTASGGGTPTLVSDTPPVPKAVGLGSLVLLALLSLPFLGDRLAAVALAILGTAPTDDCLLEEP